MKTLINCSRGCGEAAEIIRQAENPEAVVYFVEPREEEWGIVIQDDSDAPQGGVMLGTIELFRQLDSENLNEVEAAKEKFFRHFVGVGLRTPDYDFTRNIRAAILSDALLEQFS